MKVQILLLALTTTIHYVKCTEWKVEMKTVRCSCMQCRIRMHSRAGSNDMKRVTKAARRKTKQMIRQGNYEIPQKVSVKPW